MRRGFTLVELLIVIAIIAMLAGIIFPAFAQAREKGRQATCVSNQKQIAMAVLLSAQDNNEILPPNLSVLGLSTKVLKCLNASIAPSYAMANDLAHTSLAAVSGANPNEVLLSADCASANGTVANINSLSDIAVTIHGGNGFIAAFLDGHVQFVNHKTGNLNDALNLQTDSNNFTPPFAGNNLPSDFLYQGVLHVFTYDYASGMMSGTPFAFTSADGLQYFAIHVINNHPPGVPFNLPAITYDIAPAVNTENNDIVVLSVTNEYYTFYVNPSRFGNNHTITFTTSDNMLVITLY